MELNVSLRIFADVQTRTLKSFPKKTITSVVMVNKGEETPIPIPISLNSNQHWLWLKCVLVSLNDLLFRTIDCGWKENKKTDKISKKKELFSFFFFGNQHSKKRRPMWPPSREQFIFVHCCSLYTRTHTHTADKLQTSSTLFTPTKYRSLGNQFFPSNTLTESILNRRKNTNDD